MNSELEAAIERAAVCVPEGDLNLSTIGRLAYLDRKALAAALLASQAEVERLRQLHRNINQTAKLWRTGKDVKIRSVMLPTRTGMTIDGILEQIERATDEQ